MVKTITISPLHQMRLERVVLNLLELEATHRTSFSRIVNIGVHYVELGARVVDLHPIFLNIALDLLNVPEVGDAEYRAVLHNRKRFFDQFAQAVPKGTRAECQRYVRWVKAELKKGVVGP